MPTPPTDSCSQRWKGWEAGPQRGGRQVCAGVYLSTKSSTHLAVVDREALRRPHGHAAPVLVEAAAVHLLQRGTCGPSHAFACPIMACTTWKLCSSGARLPWIGALDAAIWEASPALPRDMIPHALRTRHSRHALTSVDHPPRRPLAPIASPLLDLPRLFITRGEGWGNRRP
jgi:hypothetical protein